MYERIYLGLCPAWCGLLPGHGRYDSLTGVRAGVSRMHELSIGSVGSAFLDICAGEPYDAGVAAPRIVLDAQQCDLGAEQAEELAALLGAAARRLRIIGAGQ